MSKLEEEIKINRRYFFLFVLILGTFLLQYIVGSVFVTIDHQIIFTNQNSQEVRDKTFQDMLNSIIIGMVGMFVVIVLLVLYIEASSLDEDATQEIIYKREIPEINRIFETDCILCGNQIEQIVTFIKHIGIGQTKRYLTFCNESNTVPSLYCNKCYDMVERQDSWQKSMDEMIENAVEYWELKKKVNEKIQSLNNI